MDVLIAAKRPVLPECEGAEGRLINCPANARSLCEAVSKTNPDWIVLAEGHDEATSLLLLAVARRQKADLSFAVLANALHADLTDRWFHRGARVVLDASCASSRLLEAIALAARLDVVVLDEEVQRQVLKEQTLLAPDMVIGGQQITPTELRALRLIMEGYSNRDAARKLSMSCRTLERHLTALYAKLDARSRTEAIARARTLGL